MLDGVKSMSHGNLRQNLESLSAPGLDKIVLYRMERSEISNEKNMCDDVVYMRKSMNVEIDYRRVHGATHCVAKAKPIIEEMLIECALAV